MAIEIRGDKKDAPQTAWDVWCFSVMCSINSMPVQLLSSSQRANYTVAYGIALQHQEQTRSSHYLVVTKRDLSHLDKFLEKRQMLNIPSDLPVPGLE